MNKKISILLFVCLLLGCSFQNNKDQSVIEKEDIKPKLNIYTHTLEKNKSFTLSVTDYTGTIEWSSSTDDVAVVDNGKVTGKSLGTAIISAKVNHTTLQCVVNVIEPIKTPAYKMSQESIILRKGDTLKLTVIHADKKVVYSSKDYSIAGIDSRGIVSAKKAGTTYVYASIDKIKLKCKVVVKEDEVTLDLNDAKKVFDLQNEVRLKNGVSKLTWDFKVYQACLIRAKEISTKFSHTRPDNTNCFTALDEVNCKYLAAGENLAKAYSNEQSITLWKESEGHFENMISSQFSKGAIAKIGNYYVAMFIN